MNKQDKTVVKIMTVFNLPLGRGNSKSCQFHEHMLVYSHQAILAPEGAIRKVSKIITSEN